MTINWRNGTLTVGWLLYSDTWGISLAWGRRDLIEGRVIPPGETLFADYVVWHLVEARDVIEAGSLLGGFARRLRRLVFA